MKVKSQYVCQNCGFATAKWLGRCPSCESWNTFQEEKTESEASAGSIASVRDDFKEFKALGKRTADFVSLEEVESKSAKIRLATGMAELDRTLGGGLVPDAFTLLGGDPGIGKSTLLLQLAKGLLARNRDLKILYVSGEESLDQIAARAKRMKVEGNGRIYLAAETQLERVFANVLELKPNILFMDSLQTFSSAYSQSAPGSVSQVRYRRVARRARDQRGHDRRSEDDRAHGRYGPLLRRRRIAELSPPPHCKKSFRLHERTWRFRNGCRRTERSAQPFLALSHRTKGTSFGRGGHRVA
jgi:predicted ATP-dependent serine protease